MNETIVMKISYATDFHGNLGNMGRFLEKSDYLGVKDIIIGGDIAPRRLCLKFSDNKYYDASGGFFLERQPDSLVDRGYIIKEVDCGSHDYFKRDYKQVFKNINTLYSDIRKCQEVFVSEGLFGKDGLIKEFKEKHPDTNIYVMPGNDDSFKILKILVNAEKSGLVKQIHMKSHKIFDEYNILGYSFVPPSPFKFKEWEKFDLSEKEAMLSESFDVLKGRGTIRDDLDKLDLGGKRTIFVSHAPPYNTNLDVTSTSEHVGSQSIRDFIIAKKPLVSLHGHIHESSRVSGKMEQRINGTLALNPGSSDIDLNMVVVDIDGSSVLVKKIGL